MRSRAGTTLVTRGQGAALREDVRGRWPKFSDEEVAALTSTADVIAGLEKKYGMTSVQTERAVQALAKGREF